MAYSLTPERIAELEKRLQEHPIDHRWDEAYETLDAYVPPEERLSRNAYSLLKLLGELPEEPK